MRAYTEILRGLREDKDLKQSDIAKLIGTTQQQYSKYETGESELPLRALAILSDYYNISADFLMGRTDCMEGAAGLNRKISTDCTAGRFISDLLSLSDAGRQAVIEYVGLQKLKETTCNQQL